MIGLLERDLSSSSSLKGANVFPQSFTHHASSIPEIACQLLSVLERILDVFTLFVPLMPARTPIEEVAGNASDEQKEGINDAMFVYCQESGFCYGISDRMRLVEAAETGANLNRAQSQLRC